MHPPGGAPPQPGMARLPSTAPAAVSPLRTLPLLPTALPAARRQQGDGEWYLGFVNREGDEPSKRATKYRGAKDGKPDTRITAYFRALVGWRAGGWLAGELGVAGRCCRGCGCRAAPRMSQPL